MCHTMFSQNFCAAFEQVAAFACSSQSHHMGGFSFPCASIVGTISVVSIFITLQGVTIIPYIALILMIFAAKLTILSICFKTNAY